MEASSRFNEYRDISCLGVNYLFIRFSISCSTTVGSASVVVSPRFSSSLAATLRRIRLIIFPDLVFGRPGANCIISGLANAPISFPTKAIYS